VLERRQTLDQALDHALARTPGLDPRDRQLARAITTFALKRLGSIRAALDARLKKTLAESPADFGANLIVGAAQILTMAVPAHAAVDLAVTLTAADRTLAGLTGVVNAVLRRIADERDAILAGHDPRIDLPAWLIARWDDTYGRGRATAIAAATAQESTLDVTALADPARWAEALGGRLLANGSIRLDSHAPVQSLQGYEDGVWFVQDAAAAAPAPLLRARPGERVLDLCAAPGGKTAQLAATGADVTAIDRSAPRLKRVAENLARLKLSATLVAADAATWDGPPADAILLDAPCAGTGTIRRHPDIAWTKTPEDVATLAALQTKLLDRAAALLRPGGRLVYSTCSLEPEEGERQIAALLARRPDLARDPVRPGEAPGFDAAIDADGALRTTPEMWPDPDPRRAGLDGFYAARVRRAG
jgi:16S rRNA (cytosine967-C5)-methyltransferase